MRRVAICLRKIKNDDTGGAETVAYRILGKLEAEGIRAEILWVPDTFLTRTIPKRFVKQSVLAKMALSILTVLDVWLNFAITSLRHLDYDLVLTLQWNTLYLRHSNMMVYFLSHDRNAYDLYDYTSRYLNTFGKITLFLAAISRRLVDRSVIAKIRNGRIPVFAISRNVANRLEKYWRIQASRIIYPGGYEPDIFYDESREYVLYFGRLDWNIKRLSLVYDVARMLPEIPFVVAGGPLHQSVDTHILRPPDNVRLELFNGLCPINSKARIYSRSSCVLYPSRDEDFGIVPVEAMSAGKPCVACTDGGGVTETIIHGQTGLIVAPTPEALAVAVKHLHRYGASMKRACEERARIFSWDRCLSELSSEIQSLINLRAEESRDQHFECNSSH
ncbi:MAG: glycosyltransferase family 4 protein [Candidatus Bathyarchaeia archaeon]